VDIGSRPIPSQKQVSPPSSLTENRLGENLRLVERYTRISPDVLKHEITLTDPDTWTSPWTVELLHTATMDPIFEYACHEGNYSMPGILGGARLDEQEGDAQ